MSFPRFLKSAWSTFGKHNLTWLGSCSRFCKITNSEVRHFEEIIVNNTMVSDNHLTPELKLRLITPECKLWHCPSRESEFPDDPFWGIYWPGGQALGRYILDNNKLFHQKNVLDIGSGSGACALAAARSGAQVILANDTDPISQIAVQMNSKINNLKVHTSTENLIGKPIDDIQIKCDEGILQLNWDIILIGDMFYDTEFAKKLFLWLIKLAKKNKLVLVGDPGRHALKDLHELKDFGVFEKLSVYSLINSEHNGFSNSCVYKVNFIQLVPLFDLKGVNYVIFYRSQ